MSGNSDYEFGLWCRWVGRNKAGRQLTKMRLANGEELAIGKAESLHMRVQLITPWLCSEEAMNQKCLQNNGGNYKQCKKL